MTKARAFLRWSSRACQYPESQIAETPPFDAALVDFGLGPHEWLGIVVVALDEGIDVLLELLERGERGAGQRLTLQDREPAFDLVEPRRPRGCVVECHEWM